MSRSLYLRSEEVRQLKELRLSKGLTRKELAKQFGMSERTITRWENRETDMLLSTAVKLAEFYGVSMEIFKQGQCHDKNNRCKSKKI